jgi:threonine dehydrogenase-like Zn-dependent dehydrogenase
MRAIFVDKILPKMLLVKALGHAWPGIVWSPLSSTQVADLPTGLPGPRWVRVRNLICGVCASDLSLLFVHADPAVGPAALPGNQRFYLGHEVVSVVEEVGAGVTRVRPGDRVAMDLRHIGPNCLSQEIEPVCRHCADGQYCLCENASANQGPRGVGGGWGDGYTAHETELYPVPSDIGDDQAAMLEPMAVGLHAVLRRPPAAGEHVLILGCGIIGLLTLQAARAVSPECRITAIARYPHQGAAAKAFGADTVVSRPEYADIAKLTGARHFTAPMNKGMLLGGFDVVYDCVGNARTVEDSLRWSRALGTVVIVGVNLSRLTLDISPIWYQEVGLTGSLAHGTDAWKGERRHTYDWVIELLRAGKMKTDGVITHRFRLEDYRQAIDTYRDKSGSKAIKVVFDYS